MKADIIIKNAKIFTSDRDDPQASALAVKDGKFVYVGDETGLSEYEGEVTSFSMFVLSELLARPYASLFLQNAENLLPDAMHMFRIISATYLFTGTAIFSSALFTALNNGLVSALISFLRTFVFELGAVLVLPLLFGIDGIWYSVVFSELMAAVVGIIFMTTLRSKYHY